MAKLITSEIFEQAVKDILQGVVDNLYEFEEYTDEEVANLIDLSEEEVAELTRVINDTTVALNKVYSNKKVEDLLSELEVTCNKYADEKIGGLAGIHLAYVDTLPTTGEDNVIYILKSTTGGNDTLNLYNNGWISIGEFTISLDNYYDKAEVDALLNDKANANEVISQDDVVGDMSNISSSTVLSTAGLEVELNKKVDKDSIVTVLDDSVTDEQIPSAKVVYDSVKDNNVKTYYNLSQLGLTTGHTVQDVYMAMDEGSMAMIAVVGASCTDAPDEHGVLVIEKQNTGKVNIVFKQSYNDSVAPNCVWIGTLKGSDGTGLTWNKVLSMEEKTYMEAVVIEDVLDPIIENADILFHSTSNTGSLVNLTGQKLFCVECRKRVFSTKEIMLTQTAYQPSTGKLIATRSKNWWNSTWSAWNLVCSTTVADVPRTDITSKLTNCSAKFIGYSVKDGICRVMINGLKPNTQAVEILATGILPNKDSIHNGHFNVMYTNGNMALFIIYNSSTDGVILNSCNSTISGEIYCTLEYPVAE